MPIDTLAGTDTEAPVDDLRASLTAQFDAAETSTEPTVTDEPVEATEQSTETEQRADHPTDPARYADGTFKKTKAEAAAEQAAPVDPKLPSKDDLAKASTQPASTPAEAPPAGWTAAEKAEWSKLPPAVQAAVSRREAEMTNGGKQWSDEKRRYEAAISPIADLSRARGIDVEQGIRLLVSAQRMLDQNPAEGIRHIAKSYGVNLATLAGQAPAEGSSEASQQPDIAALVRQAIQPILAPIQERFYGEDRQRQQSTVNLVTDFASSPGHEHFDAVQDEIMALIPQIRNVNPSWPQDKVLQESYDRAVYANPTTRASLLASQSAAADTKRREDAAKHAKNARLASSSVTGSPGGSQAPQAHDTLRGELEAAFASAR